MSTIDVLTGQHIKIGYHPANILQRIFGVVIDSIFQILYMLSFYFILEDELDFNWEANDLMSVLIIIVFILPVLCYHFFFELWTGGQTPGKMLMKIKVTNLDGSVTGIGGYFMRWVLRPIDMIFGGGVGLIFILLSKNHQRLGDLAAKTIVIKIPEKKVDINPEYYTFGENYMAQYPQVENLSEGQIKLIVDMLDIYKKKEDKLDYDFENRLDNLASKTKTFLNISSGQPSPKFLIQVVKDYNYFASLGF